MLSNELSDGCHETRCDGRHATAPEM